MSKPMSPDCLAEIAARAEDATEGPWDAKESKDAFLEEIWARPGTDSAYQLGRVSGANLADAAFIAHAREDVPALVAEVERLRAELDAAFKAGESHECS